MDKEEFSERKPRQYRVPEVCLHCGGDGVFDDRLFIDGILVGGKLIMCTACGCLGERYE